MRSIGPDTEIAAMTTPRLSRTGADTLATPGSRSATLCAQPRRRTSANARSVNLAVGSTACCVAASLYASSTLAPDPAVIGNRAPTGTVSLSPAGGWLPPPPHPRPAPLAPIPRHAFPGDLARPRQQGGGGRGRRVIDLSRQLAPRRAQPPPTLAVAGQ